MKLTKEIANNAMTFLDRVSVTGHQERLLMNQVADSLFTILKGETEVVEVPKKKDGKANTN